MLIKKFFKNIERERLWKFESSSAHPKMANSRKRKCQKGSENDSSNCENLEHQTAENEKNEENIENENMEESNENSTCLSLSIEETNKLREKLGLAPLKFDDTEKKKEFVHQPAKNIADEEMAEKYREKIKLMREKREIEQRAKKVKKIYELDNAEEIDDVAKWVERSRNLKQPKETKKSKIEEDLNDLKTNIIVEHDQREFEVGEEAILTLKDADVLQEEDALININLIEKRKAIDNIKNRTKASDYNPYDEFDEITGQLKPAAILSKYDEEISGKQLPKFQIQTQQNKVTNVDTNDPFIESMKGHSKYSLNIDLRPEKDYFTPDEYNLKFKKPKKRKEKNSSKRPIEQTMEIQNEDISDQKYNPTVDIQSAINEDEASLELQKALERVRQSKLKASQNSQNLLKAVQKIKNNEEIITTNKGLVLDSVSEFVRIHNSRPLVDEIKDSHEMKDDDNKIETEIEPPEKEQEIDDKKVFDEEPVILKGIGSALQILSRKGYLETDKKSTPVIQTNVPKTIATVDTEKMKSLHKASRRPDRNESEEYKFEIDVGHYDKKGNLLDPKNAFRELSYKFHGKKPTKKKKAKKADEPGHIKSDIDLAKSLSIMHDKQKKNQAPYLVLTGSNMNILSSNEPKKK